MIGDIGQMDGKLDEDCGITPRIFEYLFKRIQEVLNMYNINEFYDYCTVDKFNFQVTMFLLVFLIGRREQKR